MVKSHHGKVVAADRQNAHAFRALETARHDLEEAERARESVLDLMAGASGLGCIRATGHILADLNRQVAGASQRVRKAKRRLQRTVDLPVAPPKTYIVDAAELDVEGCPCAGMVYDAITRKIVATARAATHDDAMAAALRVAIKRAGMLGKVVIDCGSPAKAVIALCVKSGISLQYRMPYSGQPNPIERYFRDMLTAWGLPDVIDTGATQ